MGEQIRLQEEEEERKRLEEEANKKGKKGKKPTATSTAGKEPAPGSPNKTRVTSSSTEAERGENGEKSLIDGNQLDPLMENQEENHRNPLDIITTPVIISDEIIKKFRYYERSLKDVQQILNFW